MIKKILVNEIHTCLQGEGTNLGKPSVLVRLQICNLRCSWCDTSYTHTYKSDSFNRYTVDELSDLIFQKDIPHVIFTGGEPTLQNLGLLSRTLLQKSSKFSFEVESNGTQIPHKSIKDFLYSDYALMQWNISPKFENANQKLVNDAMEFWARLSENHSLVFFKFVIRKRHKIRDLQKILEIITKFKISHSRILLMAEGTTQKSQLSNEWLHDICLEHGFRLTPRLHVLIFGAKRGV